MTRLDLKLRNCTLVVFKAFIVTQTAHMEKSSGEIGNFNFLHAYFFKSGNEGLIFFCINFLSADVYTFKNKGFS